MARPMPDAPPVMRTRLPVRLRMASSMPLPCPGSSRSLVVTPAGAPPTVIRPQPRVLPAGCRCPQQPDPAGVGATRAGAGRPRPRPSAGAAACPERGALPRCARVTYGRGPRTRGARLTPTRRHLDTSLSPEQRADLLLAEMTLEEKIGQMCQYVDEPARAPAGNVDELAGDALAAE